MSKRYKKVNIDETNAIIELGRAGENDFSTVEFDTSAWGFGNMTFELVYVRPDGECYSVPCTMSDGKLIWTPSGYDTAVAGMGRCEIRAYEGDTVGKSATFKVSVEPSITAECGEPGITKPDWVEDIMDCVVISSIEQTNTSSEDGGVNTFTVTLTNGDTAEFNVRNGSRGATGEKGERGEQGIQGPQGERGYSGLVPYVSLEETRDLVYTIPANTMAEIPEPWIALEIIIGEGVPGYDNEWGFTISMGELSHPVLLPEIEWTLGIAPLFDNNTTTQCRLFYVGETLCGEWVCV